MFTIENIKQAIVNRAEVGKEYRQTEIGKLFEAEFNVKIEEVVGDDGTWGELYNPFRKMVTSDTCPIEGLFGDYKPKENGKGNVWRWVYNPSTPVARVVKKVTRKPEEKDDAPVAPVKAMKLYAFCYPDDVRKSLALGEPFKVKIGQTINEAQERIDGQTSGSGVSEDPVTLWTTTLNGEVKTDHQFHQFLVSINSGVTRVKRDKKKTTEWFDFECRDNLRNLAAKLSVGVITDEQFIEELSGYVTKVLNKALEHQERQLAPVKAPELSVVYQEVIKVMLPWVAELNGLKKWYEDEVMVQDMKYISDEKWNQPYVMTHELAVMMMSKVVAAPSMHNTFLVIEAVELVDCLVKLGYDPSCIQFMSTSDAKRYAVESKYGISVRNGRFAIETYRQKNKKGDFRFMSKFDYCLMNPPYESGMGEDFLNMAIDMSHRIVCVAPATWALNRKPGNRDTSTLELIDSVKEYGCSIDLVNGNSHFGALIDAPIAMTHIDTLVKSDIKINGETVDFDHISVAGVWAARFIDMIQDDNLHSHANRNAFGSFTGVTVSEGAWYVNQCWKPTSGSFSDSIFYTFLAKKTVPETTRATNTGWVSWAFDTEQEALNFINYGKTKFARFMLSLYKMNGNIHRGELAAIPWMDFTQEWTDEKLCKHFGITKAEWTKINEFIPDYY